MDEKNNIEEVFDKGTYIGELNELQLKLIIKHLMQMMSYYGKTIDIIFDKMDLYCGNESFRSYDIYSEIIKQQLRVINKIGKVG